MSTHQLLNGEIDANVFRKPGLEMDLTITRAKIIAQFQKVVHDYATHVCCSCQLLFKHSAVTVVKFSDG